MCSSQGRKNRPPPVFIWLLPTITCEVSFIHLSVFCLVFFVCFFSFWPSSHVHRYFFFKKTTVFPPPVSKKLSPNHLCFKINSVQMNTQTQAVQRCQAHAKATVQWTDTLRDAMSLVKGWSKHSVNDPGKRRDLGRGHCKTDSRSHGPPFPQAFPSQPRTGSGAPPWRRCTRWGSASTGGGIPRGSHPHRAAVPYIKQRSRAKKMAFQSTHKHWQWRYLHSGRSFPKAQFPVTWNSAYVCRPKCIGKVLLQGKTCVCV